MTRQSELAFGAHEEREAIVKHIRLEKGPGNGYPAIILERLALDIEAGEHRAGHRAWSGARAATASSTSS